jgi:hypothetical protein
VVERVDQVGFDDVEAYAAAIAPVIDRLRIGVMERVAPKMAPVGMRLGVGEAGGRTLAMLRNVGTTRSVAIAEVEAVFRYLPEAEVAKGIAQLDGAGLVEAAGPGRLRLTEEGQGVVGELRHHGAVVAAELWPDDARLGQLDVLAGRALDAARQTGGAAFSVMDPGNDPSTETPDRLAERLAALRFHRYDCHVAAWTAAGLTAEQVTRLGPGPRRDEIEADTNHGAGSAYAVLDGGERLALLAGLAALRS